MHWIRGINGAGKSTLLKSIAGIIPFEGEITIDGLNLKGYPVASRRRVTYSEAEPVYPSFLCALDMIDFVAQARKSPKEAVREIVEYFSIDSFAEQAIGGYSTGMLKKLSLCLAFIGAKSWILLDEPFAFIDQETEEKLKILIRDKREKGLNFIITSHHEVDCDHMGVDKMYSILNNRLLIIK